MKAWTEWEIVRRQVAIAGRVVDERDRPVLGVQVTLVAMPDAMKQRIEAQQSAADIAWGDSDDRYDQTFTRPDGIYYFLDLPAGKYTVEGLDRRSNRRNNITATVSWNPDGNIEPAMADLELVKP